jgi:hypothetical protein
MISLYARRKELHGKPVSLRGFLSPEYEDYALYMSRDTYEYFQTEYSVNLSLPENKRLASAPWKGRFVAIEGTFEAINSDKGAIGRIKNIRRMMLVTLKPGRRVDEGPLHGKE